MIGIDESADAARLELGGGDLTIAVRDETGREVIEAVHVGRQPVHRKHERRVGLTEPLGVHTSRRQIEVEFVSHGVRSSGCDSREPGDLHDYVEIG